MSGRHPHFHHPNVHLSFAMEDEDGHWSESPNLPSSLLGSLFASLQLGGFGGGMGGGSLQQLLANLDRLAVPQGGGSYDDILDYLFQQYEDKGPPPASAEYVDKLPETIIGPKEVSENAECSVCKDRFTNGESVLKLPCLHLYHRACILPWLKDHNTCPTCRYELPTNDEEFEEGRKKRMATRKIDDTAFSREVLSRCDIGKQRDEDCILLQNEFDTVQLRCSHKVHSECLESFLRVFGTLDYGHNLGSLGSNTFPCIICKQTTSMVVCLDNVD